MSHCARSLTEFTEGQCVRVVFGPGDLRPGVVERVLSSVVRVRLADHSLAECRPYAVVVEDGQAAGEDVATVQGELFARAEVTLGGAGRREVRS